MIKRFITILLAFSSFCAVAQKEDYTWLAGYLTQNYDSGTGKWIGQSRFDFNQTPVAIALDSIGISFQRSNSMISDADGNLLLSCNGVKVHNRYDEKIIGSDTLGNVDGGVFYFYLYPNAFALGVPHNQQHITLTNPVHSGYYDIFHTLVDSFEFQGGYIVGGKKVLKTIVDVNANFTHGAIVEKDLVVATYENSISIATARHGNGKDWWVCTNQTSSNCYTLMYHNGIDTVSKTTYCGGGSSIRGERVTTGFSLDGAVYASVAESGLNIFNFDRCSGALALNEFIFIPELIDSLQWSPNSIMFSPNNRFLYLFTTYRIFQFDMWANPIAASRKTVAAYDPNFSCPFAHTFRNAQLAPDGQIYISSGNTNYCLSVIKFPDNEGDQCGFIRYGVDLPNFISGLPYFPNYRLGALSGSPCDTITGIKDIAEKEKLLKIFPNPAADVATIDYGYTDWSKGEATMEISNNLGQVVHSQILPMYSGFQKLEVGKYPSGAYTVYIKRKGVVVATGYLVKE